MPSRSTVAFLAVILLAFAGCGSSKKATTTAPTRVVQGVTAAVQPFSYTVIMTGAKGLPKGAPHGSGIAVINLKPASNELCWQFSQLTGIETPTAARIYIYVKGGPGTRGLPLGHTYTPAGCIHVPPIAFALFESHPQRYWVNIHTARFPGGAVRGPL